MRFPERLPVIKVLNIPDLVKNEASSSFHSVNYYYIKFHTGCPKNGVLTVHYGVEETTVNVRKMFKKFYWT
jgi:hypothetical protein